MSMANERLVVLGLDGATWTVLDPMIARGWMPNLSALLTRSAYGTLRSTIPPVTSAAWTTMQTGANPAIHGVFDHRYYDARSGQMKVNHSGRIRVPTTWQLLSDAGRSVVSLNLPGTFPPPKVRGVIVSGMDAPHLDAALTGYPEFAARLKAEAPDYTLRYFWKRPPETLEELTENARLTAESFRGRAEGGIVADRFVPDWSVMMVQFQNLDPFQHRAWRYLNVDETGIDAPAWNDAAGEVIRGLDRAIGVLCELAEKRNARVLAVSDHGFGPCLGRVHVNRILIEAGLAALPSAGGKLMRSAAKAAENLRLWGAKRDDPEARSASFDLSVFAQFPFDWNRTAAFAPHQDTAAMIYLNRKNASSSGRRDDVVLSTIQALQAARHPELGTPLFPQVIDMAATHGIDPEKEGYPDVLALPDEPYWVRTKLAPGSTWVEADAALPGTHRPEGIVAFSGSGIAPGRNLKVKLVDIAPTILSLFGQPIPSHVEGTPLPCLPHLSTTRLDAPSANLSGPHQSEFEYSAEEQAIIEQRLADLGYLE